MGGNKALLDVLPGVKSPIPMHDRKARGGDGHSLVGARAACPEGVGDGLRVAALPAVEGGVSLAGLGPEAG